jgi:hypothetical protein
MGPLRRNTQRQIFDYSEVWLNLPPATYAYCADLDSLAEPTIRLRLTHLACAFSLFLSDV